MIKKFFLAILLCFSIFSLNLNLKLNFETVNASCNYSQYDTLSKWLEDCFSDSKLVKAENLKVDWNWFKQKIIDWRNRIAFFVWIFAVLWLVVSGFTLVTSAWDDEKINKAKSIFKWTLFWVLAVIFASAIITLVINIFYSI